MNKSGKKSSQGFTLIELMIVVVLLGFILAFAIPAIQEFINRGRITGVSSDLTVDLANARMEAIRRGITISVCASVDKATCDTSAQTDWAKGWIVFSDRDSDASIPGVSNFSFGADVGLLVDTVTGKP